MTGFSINIGVDLGSDNVDRDILVQNNFETMTGDDFLLVETTDFFLLSET